MRNHLAVPQIGEWEVDLVDVPQLRIQGEDLQGMLVAVDRETGVVRCAVPVVANTDVTTELFNAAMEPVAGAEPGRPEVIWCRPSLMPRIANAAMVFDARLRAASALPGIDEMVESLVEHLVDAPDLVPLNPRSWVETFRLWCETPPWQVLTDETYFVFDEGHPSLLGRVAIVIGCHGEQRGLVLFRDEPAYETFRRASQNGPSPELLKLDMLCAHFELEEELVPTAVEELRQVGLVHRGLALVSFANHAAGPASLTSDEETICIAALQAVYAGFAEHGAALEFEAIQLGAIPTRLGPVSVVSSPGEGGGMVAPTDLLEGRPHQYYCAQEGTPDLVIKLSKRDALALARDLEEVDGITLEGGNARHNELWLWSDEHGLVGALYDVPHHPVWERWADEGGGDLVVSAGGAKRKGVRNKDIVWSGWVEFEDNVAAPDGVSFDMDGPDPAARWPRSAWEGRPTSWPKASDVLVAFAAPLRVQELPMSAAEQALTIAATVFSAVSQADVGADRNMDRIQDLMNTTELGDHGLVEALIERKRRWFANDTRIMQLSEVGMRSGELRVHVHWTMADGSNPQ